MGSPYKLAVVITAIFITNRPSEGVVSVYRICRVEMSPPRSFSGDKGRSGKQGPWGRQLSWGPGSGGAGLCGPSLQDTDTL